MIIRLSPLEVTFIFPAVKFLNANTAVSRKCALIVKNWNGGVHIYSIQNSQISANRAHPKKVSMFAMDLLSN